MKIGERIPDLLADGVLGTDAFFEDEKVVVGEKNVSRSHRAPPLPLRRLFGEVGRTSHSSS
jgi:hypothetical protein